MGKKLLSYWKPILLVILVFSFAIIDSHFVQEKAERERQTSHYKITQTCHAAKEPEAWAASDDRLYIAYSPWDYSYVDVYDNDLQFLYSIEFWDDTDGHGVVEFRCQEGCIFINLRKQYVHAFKEQQEVGSWTTEEADALGYDHTWFYNGAERIHVEGKTLNWLNEDGSVKQQFQTGLLPDPEIKNRNGLIYVAGFLIFWLAMAIYTFRRNRREQAYRFRC